MRHILAGLLLGLAIGNTTPAIAQDQQIRGVVELFTSQGCSSCPPADRVLSKLATSKDVLALAYHVDYWDYLGWKDTLGNPENTARQYAYRNTLRNRSAYTPQAVINGRKHLNGGDGKGVAATLAKLDQAGSGMTVPVSIAKRDGRLHVEAGAKTGAKGNLLLVFYKDRTSVKIARGENAGETITYHNAVSAVQTIGMWDGKEMAIDLPETELAAHEANGCAVMLQTVDAQGNPGAILGAAILPRLGS